MRPPTILAILSIGVLLILGIGYLIFGNLGGKGQTPPSGTANCPPEEEQDKVYYTIRGGGEGGEYDFTPDDQHVKKCQRVTINFINDGKLPHTWTVRGIIDTGYVNGGSQKEVTFTAPDGVAEVEIICAVPGHKEKGMVGRLIVE